MLVMYSSWDCELEEKEGEEGWVGTPKAAESSRVSVMVGSRSRDRSSRLCFILCNRERRESKVREGLVFTLKLNITLSN